MYGSPNGRYHPNATRARSNTYEPRPERVDVPDSPEIVSFTLHPTGRQTKAFQIFEHPPVNDDGKADCIILTKDGIYIPLEHYLSTVPIQIVVRAAPNQPTKRTRVKGKPAAKKPAAKTTTSRAPAATKTTRTPASK
jgi:hypothetical protein